MWSMTDAPKASSWPARVLLLGIYLIWVGVLLLCAHSEAKWAGVLAGILLVLIWLPYDVHHKRHELLTWLPLHATVVVAATLIVWFVLSDHPHGAQEGILEKGVLWLISGTYSLFQHLGNQVWERREAERTRRFVEERRGAPKVRPVARWAGKA